MAGPSVVVRVLGDLRGLGQAMDGAGKTASSAASKAHSAFSGMLGALNRTGVMGPFGAALDGIDAAIGSVVDHGHEIGPMMAGVGAGVAGVGTILAAFGSKEQASHQQLQAAIDATGHAYSDYGDEIEKAIKHQENFGHTANQTQDALRILTQATHDPAKALQLLNTTSDLAAAKHMDLAAAATTMGRAYNGNTKVLKEFGIVAVPKAAQATKALGAAMTGAESAHKKLSDAQQHLADVQASLQGKSHLTAAEQIKLRDALQRVGSAADASNAADKRLVNAKDAAKKAAGGAQTNIDALAKTLRGQASASADTFGGKIAAMRAHVEDVLATFGQRWGPILQTAGIAIMSLGSMMTIFGTITWSTMLPILAVIAAIAALIVIGYVIYRNWNTIWGGIKAVVSAVWDWIKTHWPLLLAIIMGPIGIAIAWVIQHFDAIKSAVAAVINFVKTVWNGFVSFLRTIGSTIASILGGWFNALSTAASTVVGAVKGIWNGFVSWVEGLGTRITNAAKGMWDGVSGAFKAAINAIIGFWNRLHFTMGGWTVGVGPLHYTFPQFTFGMPTIPTLAAGGLMTSSGLVFAHAGEVISPAPASALGPGVVIENAHFAEAVDIDLFMRRAAWEMQRARA